MFYSRKCPKCGSEFVQYDPKNLSIKCFDCKYDSEEEARSIVAGYALTVDNSKVDFIVGSVIDAEPTPRTLQIDAEKIIIHHKELNIDIPIQTERFSKFEKIIINGVTFTRIDKVD